MSKIWDELLEKSKELGIYEGERQGRIEGERQGRIEGERQGRIEGINNINALNSILIKAGRLDDLTRATSDPDYQKKLMAELLPSA